MNKILHPLARLLVSAIFLSSGYGKITGFAGTSKYMASHNIPAPDLFLLGAIVFEVAGALMLLFGYRARLGAVLLVVFLIPVTLIFHVPGIPEASQMIATLKNLAILGALTKFIADGAGSFSIDNK